MQVRMIAGVVLVAGSSLLMACGDDDDAEPTPAATTTASASTVTPGTTPAATAPATLITIDIPPEGAHVSTPIELSGTANTFEAALTVDVLDATGDALCARSIMATSGSGTPGTWATTLDIPPPDAETPVTLRAYEFSAMDGSIINLVERDVTLSTERPPLFITSPECGATVAPGSALVVEGRGVVFEAAFNLELRDAAGTAVATASGMAGGTEEMPFSVTMTVPTDAPNGKYDLVAFSFSAEDGSVQNEFSVQIFVQA